MMINVENKPYLVLKWTLYLLSASLLAQYSKVMEIHWSKDVETL